MKKYIAKKPVGLVYEGRSYSIKQGSVIEVPDDFAALSGDILVPADAEAKVTQKIVIRAAIQKKPLPVETAAEKVVAETADDKPDPKKTSKPKGK